MDLDRTLAFVPGVSRAQGRPLSGAEWWEQRVGALYWTILPEDPNSPGQVSCPSSMFPWDPNQCPHHVALVTVY